AMIYFARALGAAHAKDLSTARSAIDNLQQIRERLAQSGEAYWAEQVEIQRRGATAWLAFAQGHGDEALIEMRDAAAREDATDKSAVTPGPLAPARELLADLLVELGRPADALTEYQATLKKEPNRFRTLLARHAPPSSRRTTPRRAATI